MLDSINFYCGTSIGSIFAALLSIRTLIPGYNYEYLYTKLYNFEYKLSINLDDMVLKYGLNNFEYIENYVISIAPILKTLTFQECYEKTGNTLLINALCINTRSNIFFSHHKHPNMPILTAIKASMAIPFIFNYVSYQNNTYIDGGITNIYIPPNLTDFLTPINKSEIESKIEIEFDYNEVLCINLMQKMNASLLNIDTIFKYISQIMHCINDVAILRKNPFDEHVKVLYIFDVDYPYYNIYELNLPNNVKLNLLDLGYTKIKQFINNP
jgi:hypothetical protein